MKIMNEVEHQVLGKIHCVEDSNGNPLMWCKYENIKLFSAEPEKILIAFNLYCFNKEFSYESFNKDSAPVVEQEICLEYKRFLSEVQRAEQEFFHYYNKLFFDEFEPSIKKQDVNIRKIRDLYQYVTVKEVRIDLNSYSVIISTPWEEDMAILINHENNTVTVMYESEVEPVEMDYD